MSANLSTKLTLDGTQHNQALRDATKELSKYKREVAASDKQMKQWQQQSKTATGSINTFSDAFKQGNIKGMMMGASGASAALSGALTKLCGVFGATVTAAEIFNKTIHSSQTLTDEFGAIQMQVTTVVDDFFQSLASGDFSSFINGLDGIASSAKEAYDALDTLFNMVQSFDVRKARLNNQFNANLLEIRRLKGSKNPEDQTEYKRLIEENEKISRDLSTGGQKIYNQTMDALLKEVKAGTGMNGQITESSLYRIVENDITSLKKGRERYKKEYEEYVVQLEKMEKEADKGLHYGQGRYFMGRAGANFQNDKTKLEQKYGEAIAANYLLERKSDEELTEFNNKLKQGLSYQDAATTYQSRLLRYTKETNTEQKKLNQSRGKGGKVEVKYPEGSIGWIEDMISKLQKEIKMQLFLLVLFKQIKLEFLIL